MPRPIFTDENLGDIDGDFEPRYSFTNGKLRLLNPIAVSGTPQNSSTMNNLFYFYNLIGIAGSKYRTSGLGTNIITETVSDISTDELIASCVSEKVSPTNWIVTEKLYNGGVMVQERRIEYNKVGNEWEAII